MFFWALPAMLKHMLDHSECLGGTILFSGLAELQGQEHFYLRGRQKKQQQTINVFMMLYRPITSEVLFTLRCYLSTKMSLAVVLPPGGFCSTMQCLIRTWATARACLTWWPPCSQRSRMKATPSGALSASWRTPSSSAHRGTRTWRGSW